MYLLYVHTVTIRSYINIHTYIHRYIVPSMDFHSFTSIHTLKVFLHLVEFENIAERLGIAG